MRRVVVALAATAMIFIAAGSAAAAIESVSLVDPTTGQWFIQDADGDISELVYGDPGDHPVMGDWDCDGIATPGQYRRSDGFVYLRNSNTSGPAEHVFFLGNPGDIPLAGDFNGDGCDSISVYRPATQTFFIVPHLGANGGALGTASSTFMFGDPGDTPVAGDWDGDGIDGVGLFRPETGYVYWRNDHGPGPADGFMHFGDPGDHLVAGRFAGEAEGIAAYRPAERRIYVRQQLTPGTADASRFMGDSHFLPVAGHIGDVSDSARVVRGEPELRAILATATNEARTAQCGTAPVTWRSDLMTHAGAHGAEMAALGYFSHTSPVWGDMGERIPGAAGENLAMHFDAAGIAAAWMSSADHRAVMCSRDYANGGVAVIGDGSGLLWGVLVLTP